MLCRHRPPDEAVIRRRLGAVRRSPARAPTRCFRRLTAAAGAPQWNFNKYLVNGAGRSSRGSPRGSSRTLGSCGSGCRCCCDSVRSDRTHVWWWMAGSHRGCGRTRRVVGGGRVDPAAREVVLAVGQSPDVDLVADVGDALARVHEDVELPSEGAPRRDARDPRRQPELEWACRGSARHAATTCSSTSAMTVAGSSRRVSSKVAPDSCPGGRSTRPSRSSLTER